jgi:hypothetical protein
MQDLLFDNSHAGFDSPVHAALGLGQEYLLTDSDHLSEVSNASSGPGGSGGRGAGGVSPSSTLVGNSHGLEIDLIWDSSVTSAANWREIESSVISAAEIYTSLFNNHDVLNIAVGFGEVAGQALAPGALGESASEGYLVPNDGTVDAALGAADAGLVHAGLMAPNAVSALDAVAGSFFITSAEAKALGLVDPAAGLDGFIGFSNDAPISFGHLLPKASQYDAIGIAAHELSEIMGRVGLEGATLVDTVGDVFPSVYTPLDLFRYTAPGAPDVTPSAGYFSLNDGVTALLPFNDPSNGGDAADWATAPSTHGNAFNAFSPTGPSFVTPIDILAMAALGYQV